MLTVERIRGVSDGCYHGLLLIHISDKCIIDSIEQHSVVLMHCLLLILKKKLLTTYGLSAQTKCIASFSPSDCFVIE